MKRLSLLVLALGTLSTRTSTAQEPPAAAGEAPAAPTRVDTLELDPTTAAASEAPPAFVSLAGDVSKTYRGVLVHVEHWVPLPEQWEITREAVLELHFSHSPVLIERLSSMTASVNGNAVNSVFLSVDNAQQGKVVWTIPPEYLKLGDSNVIDITAKMRSDLELCDDVHSPALWITIEKESRLIIRYREKPVSLDLAKFPQSYLRPEFFYSDGKEKQTHAIIAIPTAPSAEVLTGVGVVSARIGADTRFQSGGLEVRQVGDITADLREEFARNNLIIVGPTDFANKFAAAGLELVESFRTGDPSLGHLFESPNPFNPSRLALVVTGADDAALSKAVTALSLPKLSDEWKTDPKLGQPAVRAVTFATKPEIPAAALNDKLGTVTMTLADLGSSDLTQRGKFHHFARVAFPNPYVGRVQAPSFIRLIMAHSELLVPQTSSLLVKINDEPVRSIRLSPRTARRLEADVIIPEKLLGSRTLVVDLEFFLDIGDPDCRYNFPEMAWVTLFNTSFVAYTLNDQPTTSLRSYPWVAGKEPNLNGLVFGVAEEPTDGSLTVVANVAAYLGKKVPRIVGRDGVPRAQWVHPWVKRVGNLAEGDLADRDLMVVGDYATIRANAGVLGGVPENMFAESAAADNIRTYTGDTFRAEAGWIFLGKSPWNPRRNLLVVSGGRGEPAYKQASEYLWVERKVDQLAGSAVLVGPNGALEVVQEAPGEVIQVKTGDLVPQLPVYEPARRADGAALEGNGVAPLAATTDSTPKDPPSAAAPAAAVTTPEPAANSSTVFLVFGVLGALLLILVVVRVRDSMRSQPSAQ
ncbi:MAG: cellulose biosynthesis cyclic di-GMP-binding regulatory protein BcsB [Myxococcales bacterium]|nr:cellulose biosynthesis cyclic di-GMP-binding regulatory protein BcsB [Myxococcales bacterium]